MAAPPAKAQRQGNNGGPETHHANGFFVFLGVMEAQGRRVGGGRARLAPLTPSLTSALALCAGPKREKDRKGMGVGEEARESEGMRKVGGVGERLRETDSRERERREGKLTCTGRSEAGSPGQGEVNVKLNPRKLPFLWTSNGHIQRQFHTV